ncbi:MAG TPA: hypothetical protein VIA64_09385, partial [Burkholderiales bacterium]
MSDGTDFDVLIPFLEHLGLHLLEIGGGRARVGFDPKPEHLNSWKAPATSTTLAAIRCVQSARPASNPHATRPTTG